MIPLNIALGPKAVHYILDIRENRLKMEQHCLVYTDKMIEKYMEIDIDAADSLIEYIDAHEGEVGFSRRITDKQYEIEPLEQLIARICPKEECYFPSNIVILFEDERGRELKALGKKKSNIVTTKLINENRNNIFSMLSPDTGSMDVNPGDDCIFWAEYFKRIMEGEKTVTFVSRYGLTSDSIQSLKDYYLPYLADGTKVIMYASDSYIYIKQEEAINIIKDDEQLNKLDLELYLMDKPNTQHERWIQTENYYIYQGKGFSMLSSNKVKKISASSTVIVEKRRRKLPNAIRVL